MELNEINTLNIGYFEHGPRDQKDAFWPHDCQTCNYYQDDGCILNVERYAGLPLAEYLEMRVMEAA